MKTARRRIDVDLVELDQVLDSALEAPLSEADHDKLKDTLHALAAMLVRTRNTENGVPGKFCTGGDETNWYGRSMEWHEAGSKRRSRS